ncbi:hypothetical protein GPOL_c32960 [Gordonia polyisoprenivorans VH2]|uniref:PE domain-containing protein n=3 Tax=Gordonia TaxID=2053 RepID=H6MY83_GORPV|nr:MULTISPECIES: hypothetical protein [Gordonia]AFA74310.1 hypothetical protein GPOL_c32960 [Gordonia polyisoprenivorans VH2]MBE7192829.1 hypothetical protein [Gordonia polyisoprenivorans]MDF3284290.1 hypothetical protein [Gordonia sp. N1V]NKY04050.1 hypothetical protein [Gordonia polyisoprenivorans]UZF54703.1 hypothetical protein LH935_18445 [Gordonia polyisoprenivorans]
MSNGVLAVTPGVIETFAAANMSASDLIALASSADAEAMVAAVALAVGPIGVEYLLGYAPAQASNLAASFLVSAGHAMMSAGATGAAAGTYFADGMQA